MDERAIGERIRRLRCRRRLSQEALADFAGRTGRWLSNVEQGRATLTLRDVERLALGLRVDEAALYGYMPIPPLLLGGAVVGADGRGVNRRELLRDVAVLASAAVFAGMTPTGLGRLGATEFERLDLAVRRAARLERGSQYSAVRAVLPDLLVETERVAQQVADDDRQAALRLVSHAQAVTAWVAIKDDDTTRGELAAARAVDAAREGGDIVLIGAALRCLGEVHMRAGRYALACDLAVEAAETVGRARLDGDDALCVRGAGYLSAATACARGGDSAGACELLEAADACADRLGRDLAGAAVFGPSNVTIHRVAVPMDLGDSTAALRTAERATLELPVGFEERSGRYLIDVARGYAAHRRDDEAVRTLLQAERATAEEVRGHRQTRAVLSDLLSRERRGAIVELRPLAARCGVAS
jgi:transcriptional regulator with XRE-family HTH domain